MFASERKPPELLRAAILEKPTDYSLRARWHIGNVELLDPDALYFALGRAGRSRGPVLDEATGDFVDAEFDSAPYTHVLVDIPRELIAVAQKSSLAHNAAAIVRRLERLLDQTD